MNKDFMCFGALVGEYYFCMIQCTDMEHIKLKNLLITDTAKGMTRSWEWRKYRNVTYAYMNYASDTWQCKQSNVSIMKKKNLMKF
jgi:hypothetical protein